MYVCYMHIYLHKEGTPNVTSVDREGISGHMSWQCEAGAAAHGLPYRQVTTVHSMKPTD